MAAITVRELLVKLGVKSDTAAVKQFDSAMGSVVKITAIATAAVTAFAGAMVGAAVATARQGDEASKAAQRVGTTAEEMQELGFAAEQVGSSMSDVERAFKQQARSAVEAADGTKEYADSFRALGITSREQLLQGQVGLLEDLADGFRDLPTDVERTARAQEIFGRAGTKLVPLLKQGSEGIKRFRQEARDLGFVLSKEDAKAGEDFRDELNRVRVTMVGLRNQIGVRLIPILTSLLEGFRDFIRVNGRFIRQRIDRFMLRVEAAIGVMRRAFERVDDVVQERLGGWPALFEQIEKVGKFTATIAGLGVLIKLARAAQLAMLAFLAPGAPVLIGTLALAAGVVLLALAVEDLMVFARGGESAIGRFLEAMDPEGVALFRSVLLELRDAASEAAFVVQESLALALENLGLPAVNLSDVLKKGLFAIVVGLTGALLLLIDLLELIPGIMNRTATAMAGLFEALDPLLTGIERLLSLGQLDMSEARRGLIERARGFAASTSEETVTARRDQRQRGRDVAAFRASGGVPAVAAQTAANQAEMDSRVLVTQGDVNIQIDGSGDPRAVAEEVQKIMTERNRQALGSLGGGFR